MSSKRWPLTFKVYPGEGHPAEKRPPSERYVEVRIYRTDSAARRAVRAYCPTLEVMDESVGITLETQRWTVKGRGHFDQRSPAHVTLFLAKTHCDQETVAHEMAHAALIFARNDRLGLLKTPGGPADMDEESFCYILGRLVRGFWETCPKIR